MSTSANPSSVSSSALLRNASGRWDPTPKIAYGFAVFPFQPQQQQSQSQSSSNSNNITPTGSGFVNHAQQQQQQQNLYGGDGDASSSLGLGEEAEEGGYGRGGGSGNDGAVVDPSISLSQVPLEVGDEVYVFEIYTPPPTSPSPQIPWYRGYVVSTSHLPSAGSLPSASSSVDPSSAAFSSSSATSTSPAGNVGTSGSGGGGGTGAGGATMGSEYSVEKFTSEEPQVFVGIFPSTHARIREELDDADHRLEELFKNHPSYRKDDGSNSSSSSMIGGGGGGSGSGRKSGGGGTTAITINGVTHMEPLKEEEEEEEEEEDGVGTNSSYPYYFGSGTGLSLASNLSQTTATPQGVGGLGGGGGGSLSRKGSSSARSGKTNRTSVGSFTAFSNVSSGIMAVALGRTGSLSRSGSLGGGSSSSGSGSDVTISPGGGRRAEQYQQNHTNLLSPVAMGAGGAGAGTGLLGGSLGLGGAGAGAEIEDNRPPPPLPSLKCGDETASGLTEPLVDEIACALREWSSLLYAHLHRRDYALFNSVRMHIEALHTGRRHLLSGSLGSEEMCRLRKECVARLIRGNVGQGLEVIVRHPVWGALVSVDVGDDFGGLGGFGAGVVGVMTTGGTTGSGAGGIGGVGGGGAGGAGGGGISDEVDERTWVSGIRMYAMQVALAYGVGSSIMGDGSDSQLSNAEVGTGTDAGGPTAGTTISDGRNPPPASLNAAVLTTSASNTRLLAPNELSSWKRKKVGGGSGTGFVMRGPGGSSGVVSPSLAGPSATATTTTLIPGSQDGSIASPNGTLVAPGSSGVAGSGTAAGNVSGGEPAPKFYHVYLDLRAFVGSLASPGETVELSFSLYNKSDANYLTEEFCVVLNNNGAPVRETEGRSLGMVRTLFKDLSQHDIQDQIFLVCRVIKNGSLKINHNHGSTLSPPEGETNSFDSDASFGGSNPSGPSMVNTWRSGGQTFRRPFGCAVLEISQFNKLGMGSIASGGETAVAREHTMPIFVPVNEAAFATLHEDIIASRIKEIEKSPRAEMLVVNVRIFHGDAGQIVKENPALLQDAPLTDRLGFPDVVFPSDTRNEVYMKLWSGEFYGTPLPQPAGPGNGASLEMGGGPGSGSVSGSGSGGSTMKSPLRFNRSALSAMTNVVSSGNSLKNIEVSAEIRKRDGLILDRVISRGTGELRVSQYNSMVFKGNTMPTWGELMKLEIPPDVMEECHVFFTFRNRTSKGLPGGNIEKPFAFAYLPLFPEGSAFIADGSHMLALYRYERSAATPTVYFQAPYITSIHEPPRIPVSIMKSMVPLRDTMVIRSFLCSTRYTQNEVLLKVLNWDRELLHDSEQLQTVLTKLRFCDPAEVCKFLRNIFDALFGILSSVRNLHGEVDDLVFNALVTILGIVSDRRFSNFRPVLDVYIEHHFTNSTAWSHIIKSLRHLLSDPGGTESGQTLRAAIKVWHYLFKFVVRSRDVQRSKDAAGAVTADHIQSQFKHELSALLNEINRLMRALSPSSIIGTQTLAVQHFAAILPDLKKCFSDDELVDIAIAFGDAVTAKRGKIAIWKIILQNQFINSVLFDLPASRASLVPNIIRWLKPHLGKFDEFSMTTPKDTETVRDAARVSWLEGIRLCVGVVAAMLDRIHEALIDPAIRSNRTLLGQEQDNVEYVLSLLSRLLDSFNELRNPANLEAVERHRSATSVVSSHPVIFPHSYPFSLLSKPPEYIRVRNIHLPPAQLDQIMRPNLQNGVGEIAAVMLVMILLSPSKILNNFFDGAMQVEGKDNLARFLSDLFYVFTAILDNDAYPSDWLNINILAHRVVVKLVEPMAKLLEENYVPPSSLSYTFNTSLWRAFFEMLIKLLSSPQLVIEEFSPQKRRAVWRLAGDIRGQGAKILLRLWDVIGWPEERGTGSGLLARFGGYQVQFIPTLVEGVLELCLSHHDELRNNAVHVLYSMIVSEWNLNDDFAIIEAEVIDRLDKLFMSQTKGDEISRAFFISQLRTMFESTTIDEKLRHQVNVFLESVNQFLDLLLAIRNLPEGDEWLDDRIIGTLKLMSFIRGIGRSEIFVRYVNRLVGYHVSSGNETEAGLTLKLHADLQSWDQNSFVEPIPDLHLPRQSEFARKETLYMRILEHLAKGKAWESAIEICKELQFQYEQKSFNYERLAELLVHEAELYASIVKQDRYFSEYFRVAFYGTRFPLSVQNKQFIYRGLEWEKFSGFCERMQNKHPNAQLLKTNTIPPEEIQYADAQYLQITSVNPEPDRSSPIFTNPNVPVAIKSYYEHNATRTFSFNRPVRKESRGLSRVANEFVNLWTEKTVLICEDAFPTVLRRSEVVEVRVIELSPLENALHSVEAKTQELKNLEKRYLALSKTSEGKINTNVLSMALNGAVDAPVNGGIPMYRKAFFGTDFIAANPTQADLVKDLQSAIDEQVKTLDRCLRLHNTLCPPEMRPFHNTLQTFFERNFADEVSRLPPDEDGNPRISSDSSPINSAIGGGGTGGVPGRFPMAINIGGMTQTFGGGSAGGLTNPMNMNNNNNLTTSGGLMVLPGSAGSGSSSRPESGGSSSTGGGGGMDGIGPLPTAAEKERRRSSVQGPRGSRSDSISSNATTTTIGGGGYSGGAGVAMGSPSVAVNGVAHINGAPTPMTNTGGGGASSSSSTHTSSSIMEDNTSGGGGRAFYHSPTSPPQSSSGHGIGGDGLSSPSIGRTNTYNQRFPQAGGGGASLSGDRGSFYASSVRSQDSMGGVGGGVGGGGTRGGNSGIQERIKGNSMVSRLGSRLGSLRQNSAERSPSRR